jgi:hypothetical protein
MQNKSNKKNYRINDDEFIMLASTDMTTQELAKHFGVSRAAIKSKKKTFGINKRAKKKKAEEIISKIAVEEVRNNINEMEMALTHIINIAKSIRERYENYEALQKEQQELLKKVAAGFGSDGKLIIPQKERKQFAKDMNRLLKLTEKVLTSNVPQEAREFAKVYLQYHKYLVEAASMITKAESIQKMFDIILDVIGEASHDIRDKIVRRIKGLYFALIGNERIDPDTLPDGAVIKQKMNTEHGTGLPSQDT